MLLHQLFVAKFHNEDVMRKAVIKIEDELCYDVSAFGSGILHLGGIHAVGSKTHFVIFNGSGHPEGAESKVIALGATSCTTL